MGVVHEEKSTKNHLQKSFTATSQYWSGINKPKCVFRTTRNVSDKVLRNLKIIYYFSEFSTASLPACLMRSVKCSGKLATATALLLWRKCFKFCGEKIFHNIKYLRCVRYCLTVLSLILLYRGHLSWVRLQSKHTHHSAPTYWNKRSEHVILMLGYTSGYAATCWLRNYRRKD